MERLVDSAQEQLIGKVEEVPYYKKGSQACHQEDRGMDEGASGLGVNV